MKYNTHPEKDIKCKVKATHMFADGWLDIENVVYPSNGILISLRKEGNYNTGYNIDEP